MFEYITISVNFYYCTLITGQNYIVHNLLPISSLKSLTIGTSFTCTFRFIWTTIVVKFDAAATVVVACLPAAVHHDIGHAHTGMGGGRRSTSAIATTGPLFNFDTIPRITNASDSSRCTGRRWRRCAISITRT